MENNQMTPQPDPLARGGGLAPNSKAGWEKVINPILIAVLAFGAGVLFSSFQSQPSPVESAEEAIRIVVHREYSELANETLLQVVEEQNLCDTIEAKKAAQAGQAQPQENQEEPVEQAE